MKKFVVKDELGSQFNVEQIDEEPVVETTEIVPETTESLTAEEIVALKKLASVADKLVELLAVEDKEHAENPELVEETEEEVVDTDELEEMIAEKTEHDSKKSFGSIETKDSVSEIDLETEIANAWSKRYGG